MKSCWKCGSSAVSIFSILDDLLLDLAAVVAVEQRHQRAGAGGVADRLHFGQVAVRDEAQHHRVFRIDEGAEGAGEADRVDRLTPCFSISSFTPA